MPVNMITVFCSEQIGNNKLIIMRLKSFFLVSIVSIIIFQGSGISEGKLASDMKPLNIILFIGDGMGPAEISAGIVVSDNTLVLEQFPYSGFCKTSSSDNYVTDSAASGTAIASGTKTRNGMIGMGPDSTIVKSIMEYAHENGLSTGLVSTSAITHATPASFVSHNISRNNYEAIARDFLSGTIDVIIGGGADHFNKRSDSTDLTSALQESGYDVVYTIEDLNISGSDRVAALLAPVHLEQADKGRQGNLEKMTKKAIDVLNRNKKGFVLMVEGSQIDFAGHANDIDWLTSEVIDMDNAVRCAYEFAEETGNTLIIVTADHETGGLTLPGGNIAEKKVMASFGSKNHTAVMVPVFSYGPGAERFSGIHENTFFFNEFVDLLKLE